jgi:uroporphyrinogen decarboxylase
MKFGLVNDNWKPWRTQLGNAVFMPGNFDPEIDEKGNTFILNSNGQREAVMVPGALYFEKTCPTGLSDESAKMDPEQWRRSIPLYSDEHLRVLEENARALHDNTEYAVLGEFGKGGLGTTSRLAGHTLTDWMCLLVTEPDYCFSILQATAARAVENLEQYLQATGKYIDVILISGADYGTQKAPFFDPTIFRDLHVPNYRRINDYVHANSRAKTLYHSCGSVFEFIEYFIDAGADIINPIQATAAGMAPEKIKKTYDGRIVFWGGGVDTQTVLPFGTVEEVIEQVKERLQVFAPGGGYVFTPVHCIQHGVPPANLLAAVDTALEYGQYPIKI